THVFKKASDLDISLDVYVPKSASESSPCSTVLVWWHGGGLLQGTRKAAAPHLLRAVDEHNIVVVSADYRLAPQTRLPRILGDARDAVSWVQQEGSLSKLTGGRARPDNVFVSGSSAGGWLALLVANSIGFKECGVPDLPAKVKGCIAIYPITDISDSFWTTPQRPVSYMNGRILDGRKDLGDHILNSSSPPTTSSAPDSRRSQFYHYMIQEALEQKLLLDETNVKPRDVAVALAIKEGRVAAPVPTMLIHGDIDDKVPISQADDVAAALKAKSGCDVEYMRLQGKDHLYDVDPKEEMREMYDWIKKHV
ncbi:alpha/beta-hydrolase, partial [Jaminaea rosea]